MRYVPLLGLALCALAACHGPEDAGLDATSTVAQELAPPPPASVISAERAIDTAIAATSGRNAQTPVVAFDGTSYLVVWSDQRDTTDSGDSDIWGVRVSAAGAVLDATGIAITSATGPQRNPAGGNTLLYTATGSSP